MSNCSTASATARRKSPSPAFSSNSASTNLSSVIGSSRVLQVEVFQLHLSRLGPMATSTTPQPYTADRPENSTTSVDANNESWPVSAKATSRGARVFKTYAGWSAAGDHPRRALLVSQKAKVGVAAAVAHDRRLMEGARSSKNYGPPRGAFAGSMGANSARRSPLAGV